MRREKPEGIYSGDAIVSRYRNNFVAMNGGKAIWHHDEATARLTRESGYSTLHFDDIVDRRCDGLHC